MRLFKNEDGTRLKMPQGRVGSVGKKVVNTTTTEDVRYTVEEIRDHKALNGRSCLTIHMKC